MDDCMDPALTRSPDSAQEAFAEAIALPLSAREAFIARLRAKDPILAGEVESLLAYHSPSDAHAELDATATLPATLLGKTVGGCRIERLIGYGGMSAVYQATQDIPRRRVAVKVVRRERLSTGARRRLRVEAEALARLEHPNIARVYAAGSQRLSDRDDDGESPFLVMELIEGAVPLNTWANAAKLDARARIALVALISDAIEHAHRVGVIHRDLKPGNVLVGTDGSPKVIDFGIASVSDSIVTAVTEGPMGTLAYMSPEQARGQRVDIGSDVWGLGALLYDLLAGAPPFDCHDNSVAAHIDRLLHDAPEPIAERARAARGVAFAESLPTACDAVLRKVLANDSERRYRSAAEFAGELRRLLAGETLLARPDSEWDAIARVLRRHRTSVIAAMGIFTAVAVGLVVSLTLLTRERSAHANAQWSAYVASIAAANGMLDRNDASAAHEMLESAPMEHRGWEWNALRHLSSQSKWSVQFPIGAQVYHTDWTPDGKRIIAVAGNMVTAIDRVTRRELWRTPSPSGSEIWRAHAMADGSVVAQVLNFGLMRVDAAGRVVTTEKNDTIYDLAIDGSRTRLFADGVGGAQEIDPVTLAVLRSIVVAPPMRSKSKCIAVASDASFLVLGGDDGMITAVSAVDGATRWVVDAPGTSDFVRAVAVSRDGRLVAGASRSGIVLIDAADGSVRWRSADRRQDYRDCDFNHGGSEIIASGWNESVDRYATTDGRLIASITGPFSQVWHSAVSPDGTEIASGCNAVRVDVFDARASSRPEEFTLDGSIITAIARGGSHMFATTADGGLFSLAIASGSSPVRLVTNLHSNSVCELPSGAIVVAHDGGVAWLDDLGAMQASLELPSRALCIGTIDEGATIAVRLEDKRLLAIDSVSKELRWSVGGFERESTIAVETGVPGVVFLPRGIRGERALLDIPSMVESSMPVLRDFALCGACSPDGSLLAIGTIASASELAFLDAHSFEPIAQLPNHRGGVRAIAWSPDGERIASASLDGTVRIWHVTKQVEILTVYRGLVRDLAWDEDGTLWLACEDGLLRAVRVRA